MTVDGLLDSSFTILSVVVNFDSTKSLVADGSLDGPSAGFTVEYSVLLPIVTDSCVELVITSFVPASVTSVVGSVVSVS